MALGARLRRNVLVFCIVVFTYIVVFKTLHLPTVTDRSDLVSRGLNPQRCVHDPVPCPRIVYPERDNSSLIDLKNFSYVLDSKPCGPSGEENLLVLVHSAANHFPQRESIRTSWAAGSGWLKNLTIRVVFLLATTPDQSLQDLIVHENRRHGDTVQGDFVDSYHNLTYKHVMGLRWAVDRCPGVSHVLKMDDDIFVHLFRLSGILGSPAAMKPRTILCYVQKQMPVSRSEGGKWQVQEADYPGSFFEDYCSGWAYLTDVASARALVTESRFRPYFWVDDVHVTGTLARMAGLTLVKLNKAFTTEADSLSLWSQDSQRRRLDWGFTFGPTWGDVNLVSRAHRKVLWCRRNACGCCFRATSRGDAKEDVSKQRNGGKGAAAGRAVVRRVSR
ncbi:unnamed protein product [Ixodes hexagonus]